MSSTPSDRSWHCPSFGPTRLAVGLELEVFYTKCLADERFVIRPVFRLSETLVPPCHLCFARMTSADILIFKPSGCYSPVPRFSTAISSAANMHNWPACRILFSLTQHFMRDRGGIAFAKGDVLH